MKKSMLKAEWLQLFNTRKLFIPMIAILFIPVLYAGMFLWAFWDPYANMEDLPVAIVNMDQGAELDGEALALGEELTDSLIEDKTFKFMEVSKEDAEEGLQKQDYYVVIEIPENFSEHATTLLDDNPEKLTIVYKPNEGFNFLSAQIGETAMDRIRAEVNEKVASTYAEQLFDSIVKMGDGFGEAADGAGEIYDGTGKLVDGADELRGYLETLASSTITLANGTTDLAKGAKDAATGANELASGLNEISNGSFTLVAGAEKAEAGASDLKNGLSTYTSSLQKLADSYKQIGEKEAEFNGAVNTLEGKTKQINGATDQLAAASKELNLGIETLAGQLQPMLATLPEEQQVAVQTVLGQLDAGSANLTTGLQALSGGTSALAEGVGELTVASDQLQVAHKQALAGLNNLTEASPSLYEGAKALAGGNQALSNGLKELTDGLSTAKTGSETLAAGLNNLTDGTTTLSSGTETLASKSKELADGSSSLVDGAVELDEGVLTLKEKLSEASEETSDLRPTEKTYEMAASPVDVAQEGINAVPNYGTGFAPYFLSLGLFVGALLLSIVFPLVEPAMKPTGALAWFGSKVGVLAVVGLAQSLIAVAIVKFVLGMETTNTGLFVVTAIVTSYTFIAIVQMLVSLFGDTGRFIAILILILQLTTSAGTFPLELIPAPLQIFNTLLPMTYSVFAFKASISTGDRSFLWANNSILIAFTVACLLITFGYFALIFTRRYSKETVEG